MSHPFFAYIARMRYIVRWGLMRNTMQENIQEHSHMVAVLAHALAVIRRDKFGGTVDPGRVAAVALYPQEMRPAFATLLEESDPEVLVLVKAADKLSAHLKCLEELKAGNREFQSAAQQTRAALDAFHLPELDYFLAEFLPAFPLTLDELQADAQA